MYQLRKNYLRQNIGPISIKIDLIQEVDGIVDNVVGDNELDALESTEYGLPSLEMDAESVPPLPEELEGHALEYINTNLANSRNTS
ncbi:hypothetical protein Trydic_g17094 [Trypoxylus dichotomus]